MSSDFVGLRVIWPPDGTRPPKHDHDIIFVHGLHSGSISGWRDEDGVCWPAEHLSLDLENARILAFGYDPTNLNVRSDGFYEGGLLFKQGEDLWSQLKTRRKPEKIQVPITFVGHGTGAIVIKSALCISHVMQEQLDPLLRKTRHIFLLNAPPTSLTWGVWKQMSEGAPGVKSKGQWKVWSAAHTSSTKVFNEIAHYFNVTNLTTDSSSFASARDYKSIVRSIRDNRSRVVSDSDEIKRIRSWLERRQDEINLDNQQRNLAKHLPGTGEWLFRETKFRDWASLDKRFPIIWFVGPEGCGKSLLSSLAVERMRKNTQQQAVIYLMLAFDKPRSEYQLVTQIALQLLEYVAEHRGGVDAEAFLMLPREHIKDKKTSQVCELIRILISQCPAVFLFVDGLDEVGLTETREQQPHKKPKLEKTTRQLHSVMSFIADMAKDETGTPVRLWCSSKQTVTIDNWMRGLEALEFPMNRHAIVADIAQYMEYHFKDRLGSPSSTLFSTSPIAQLGKAAKTNFLFASVMANRLTQSTFLADSSINVAKLNSFKNIGELYQEHFDRLLPRSSPLERFMKQKSSVILQIISLVAYAKRPLKLVELQEALAISRKSFEEGDLLDLTDEDSEQLDGNEIQYNCAPFIEFHPTTRESKCGYVRLAHASAFVYLRGLAQRTVTATDGMHINSNLVAEVCLKYLSQIIYRNTSLSSVRTQYFYTYAAKYWHRHMEEADPDPRLLQGASDFIRSSQFLTMTRFQSFFLNRHFTHRLMSSPEKAQEEESESLSASTGIAQHLAANAGMQHLVDDYEYFISEWSDFLQLGTTYSGSDDLIENCFWGALGKQNALRIPGLMIEKNQSFLLEKDTMDVNLRLDKDILSQIGFYEAISYDGSRVAVWQMPDQSNGDSNGNTEAAGDDRTTILRDSWYIDGDRPPFRYGAQEVLDADTQRCQLEKFHFRFAREISLITDSDTIPQVPVIDEPRYGVVVRIGSCLFHRKQGRTWNADRPYNREDVAYWDAAAFREPWIIYSHRKQVRVEEEKSDLCEPSRGAMKQDISLSKVEERVHELADDTAPEVESVGNNEGSSAGPEVKPSCDDDGDSISQPSQPADTPSEARSDSESEVSKTDASGALWDSLSSAEDFCVDSPSDHDHDDVGSINNLWSSSEEESVSEDDEDSIEKDEETTDDDRDTTSRTSESSTKHLKPRYRLANEESRNMSAEASDADDERSVSRSETKPSRQRDGRPKHIFSLGLYCDLCSATIVPYNYRSVDLKEDRYYQCILCANTNCFDICSTCFGKGAWCKDPSHLLSECLLVFPKRRYYWRDGISHHIATPLIKIVAGYQVSESVDHHSLVPSFRYNRRHATMLQDSQPITHPNLPLLVYPLDGRKLLFGNLEMNTYFTYDIPFEPFETAETGLSTCIPISVALQFSPCGKFFHMLRFTARNDSLLGPSVLRVIMFRVRLSLKDPCSGIPRTLPFRQSTDLGSWPRLVPRLPYTLTWTESHVFVSMSDGFLNVFRFPLHDVGELTEADSEDMANRVCAFSRKVALPRSAQSRSINFFPSKDNASVKIILGSLHCDKPRPPIVVYLKADQLGEWLPVGQQGRRPVRSNQIREDALTEEPFWDEDADLVTKATKGKRSPILEPIMPIREQLLRGFQSNGIYCPSCFELGIKLGFFRPHPKIQFYHLDYIPTAETKTKLQWRVSAPVLLEALKAGCQFCCYIAVRTLTLNPIRHTSQSVGRGGVRCCAKGLVAEEPNDIQKVIDIINKIDWKVSRDKQVFVFLCEPQHWNIENRSFDKLLITLPSVQMGGKFGEEKFAPTMLMIKGDNELGETSTITTFLHIPELSHPGTPECVLELHALPSENLKVIKSWLHTCQSSHAFCQQRDNTNTELPTRLVEIVDGQTIKLVKTARQVGQYVALSYCWGHKPTEKSMTKVANFEARLSPRGLLRDDLPAAIRDAVTFTELLGIRHIWIDTLCIIQDEREDKHAELGKMSQYYRNSFLTIAASTPSATTGFIGKLGRCEKHPDSPLPRDLIPLDVFAHLHNTKDSGRAGKIYVREENPYQIHEEPINKRAWTLQECILAPRVLLFGSRVIWLCQHMTHSDGGVEDWSFDQNDLERTRREFQVELLKLKRAGLDGDITSGSTTRKNKNRHIYDLWHRLVGAYSRRALSYPADKLPAISAVAAEFSKLTQDKYLAGLWRSNLSRDLLWTTPEATTHRPTTWRAPTWSWASVDDAILYNRLPPESATLLAEVIEVEAVPLTAMAPFGEVERGGLIITAPSFPIVFTDEEGRKKFSEPWLKDFQFKPGKSEREMLLESLKCFVQSTEKGAKDDEKKEFQLPDEFFVVCIYGKRDELFQSNDTGMDPDDTTQRWSMWGLILKKVADGTEPQLFERVLSFSQILVASDDSLYSRPETFRII